MDDRRNRVLIVGAFPPTKSKIVGGIIRVCQTLLHSSFSDKFQIITVDSTQISNPPPKFPVRLILAIFRFVRYAVILLRSRPDAVIIFCSGLASVIEKGAMGWLAKALRVQVIMFPCHGDIIENARSNKIKRILIHLALKVGDRFICQGKQWQDFAINELGYSTETAVIIPNWTASNELLEIGKLRNFSLFKDRVEILFVGWLEREKGIYELLDAVEILFKQGLSFKLRIAGSGHAEKASRAFVKSNHLESCVIFEGWKEEKELHALYSEADIFVLPSWREGLPNAMVEAMAAGVATVITPVGNIADYATHGVDALFVNPRDAESLSRTLATLISNQQIRRELSKNGHELAYKNFASGPSIEKLSALTQDAIVENVKTRM